MPPVAAVALSVLAWTTFRDFERLERAGWRETAAAAAKRRAVWVERRLWLREQAVVAALRARPEETGRPRLDRARILVDAERLYDRATLVGSQQVIGAPVPDPVIERARRMLGADLDLALRHQTLPGNPPERYSLLAVGPPAEPSICILRWHLEGAAGWIGAALREVEAAGDESGLAARGAQLTAALVGGEAVRPRAETSPAPTAAARQPLGDGLGFWSVEARLHDPSVEQGLRRVRWTHALLVAFLLGLTVASGWLVARAVRRELRTARLRTHFVANASHELKTPLSLIRLYAETLELGRAADPQRAGHCLAVINREATRLAQLIDTVLDSSRMQAGGFQYQPTSIDLKEELSRILTDYAPHWQRAGIEVETTFPDQPVRVRFDRGAWQRSVVNLLDNGIKYAGLEKRLEVVLGRERAQACLTVRDFGVGVPAAERQRVFEWFYRVERGDAQEQSGLGLGLAMVRHAVEAHAGSVVLEAASPAGSRVVVRLPLIDPASGR